jgi:ABC-type dipeptide/oligopeptide/nickel transport system permease component
MAGSRFGSYVAKRVAFALVTIFVAITLNFVMFRALPGSAVTDMSRVPNATPALRHALEHQFGLDKSKWQQYIVYLRQLSRGNLGVSYIDQRPVTTVLRVSLANTIPMAALGTLLAIALGMVSGILASWRRGSRAASASTGTAIVFYALPTQWLGLMLLVIFAGVLPTSGMSDEFLVSPTFLQHAQDVARHMILPVMTYALTLYGQYTLIVRSAMLDTLGEDYILTARAKGLPDSRIMRGQVLRNAMLPISTLIALSLGYIVAGAILIETVFSWPGIGRAVYQAVLNRDYPLLQGAFLVLTLSVVFFNLVADLLYFKLDPRITQ